MHGQFKACRKLQLRDKRVLLNLLLRVGIVIVQPDFPHRNALFMRAQRGYFVQLNRAVLFKLRGVKARGKVYARVTFGKAGGKAGRGQVEADCYNFIHAAIPALFNKRREFAVRPQIEMAMNVYIAHDSTLPSGKSFSGLTTDRVPSGASAQTSIPSDLIPFISRGGRLVTTITFLPTISSAV